MLTHLATFLHRNRIRVLFAAVLGAAIAGAVGFGVASRRSTRALASRPHTASHRLSPPNTPRRYILNVTFSCAEPVRLGRFWANALGWPDEEVD